MRHPLVPALLVVLAVVGYALVGAVVVGASSSTDAGADRPAGDEIAPATLPDVPVGSATIAGPVVGVAGSALAMLAFGVVRRTDRG